MTQTATVLRSGVVIVGGGAGGLELAARPGRKLGRESVLLIAKWTYMSLHLMHHRAILGTGAMAMLALARLLQRRVSGRMKLY